MENSENELYSIADISRHFALPESTCRYYCIRFADYIPSVGEGRRKRFRKETINVIETIVEAMKKSRTCSAVEDILAIKYPQTALVVKHESIQPSQINPNQVLEVKDRNIEEQNLELREVNNCSKFPPVLIEFMERQTKAIENISELFKILIQTISLANSNAILATSDSTKQNKELEDEINKLKIRLELNEKNQQDDIDQLHTWMNRIVKKILKH